jgi:hypothetical protein
MSVETVQTYEPDDPAVQIDKRQEAALLARIDAAEQAAAAAVQARDQADAREKLAEQAAQAGSKTAIAARHAARDAWVQAVQDLALARAEKEAAELALRRLHSAFVTLPYSGRVMRVPERAVPPDTVSTAPFRGKVQTVRFFPPWSMCRLLLAVVKPADAPGLQERLGLKTEELWFAPSQQQTSEGTVSADPGPYLVLGECQIRHGVNGTRTTDVYGPADSYPAGQAAELTRRLSDPQLVERAFRREVERLQAEKDRKAAQERVEAMRGQLSKAEAALAREQETTRRFVARLEAERREALSRDR